MYKPGDIIYFTEDFDYKLTLFNDDESKIFAKKPYIVQNIFGESLTMTDPKTKKIYFIYSMSPDGTRDGGWDKIVPISEIREQKIIELIQSS